MPSHDLHSPKNFVVIAGRFQNGTPARFEQIRSILKIIIPKSYVRQSYQDDIALVKVATPFQFSDHIRPACLPSIAATAGTYGWILGWGDTQNSTWPLIFMFLF